MVIMDNCLRDDGKDHDEQMGYHLIVIKKLMRNDDHVEKCGEDGRDPRRERRPLEE